MSEDEDQGMTGDDIALLAIQRSIQNDKIVTLNFHADAKLRLSDECDDSVDGNEVAEFWGTTDGEEWRVHMRY